MAEIGLSPSPRLAGDADVERLNGILDTMAEMVCQFRPDGKILYANEAYANMVGVSRDAIYRGTFWEFIPRAEHERIRAELARLTPASPVVTIINRFSSPQGIRHTRWTNRGIKFDDRGRVIEAISTGIDMTDIAEAEEARRRSDDRFRQVVQCLPAAVYTTDADGRINLYNKAACELWGRTPEVGIDRWCGSPKLFYADGRDMPLDQCPMARVLRSGKPVLGEEIVIERPDGTRRNVLVYPQPMFDSAGAMIGAVKMLVDITERRAMEDSLRASEEFNRSLIESSPDCVKVVDLEGRIVRVNDGARTLMEIDDPNELCGLVWWELWPDASRALVKSAMERARAGQVTHFEALCPTAKGTKRWWEVSVSPIRNRQGGEIVHALAMSRDITPRKEAELALVTSEGQLQAIYDSGNSYLGWMTPEGTVLRANRAALAFGNVSPNQVLGRRIWETPWFTRTPDLASLVQGGVDEARVKGEFRQEISVELAGDELREFDLSIRAVRSTEGAMLGLVLEARDITDSKAMERVLRESKERWRTLANSLPQLVWTCNASGKCDFLNQRWVEYTGIDEASQLGLGWLDQVHADDRDPLMSAWTAAVESGTLFNVEFRIRRHDGVYRHFDTRGVPIKDEHGKVVRWFGTNTDVSERREAEAKLRESEQRFRTMADNISQLAWMAAPDGYLFWYNQRWYDYTGTTFDSMRGWGWQHVHHPDYVDRVTEKFRQHLEMGEVWEDTFPLRGVDGRFRWFLSRAVPVLDDQGRVVRWFGTNTDITERLEVEQELARHKEELERRVEERTIAVRRSHERLRLSERMASIGAMAAGLGHDLGNMLAPLRLRVETLASTVRESGTLEDVEAMRTSIDYLQRLASSLRALAIDPDQGSPQEPTPLGSWWAQSKPVMQSVLPRGITLNDELTQSPGERATVRIAAPRLTQAVFNLVQNAGDAMRARGHGTVTISAKVEHDELVLTVSDNGPGMTPEVLARCTEPFFSTKPQGTSSGLGLALVYSLVRSSGGNLEITSEPDRGAHFAMKLNIEQGSAEDIPR